MIIFLHFCQWLLNITSVFTQENFNMTILRNAHEF